MSREAEPTRSISDDVIGGVVTIDEAGLIRAADLGVERIFGYSRAELVGRNVSMFLPEPDRSAHDGYFSRFHRAG